MFKVSEVEGLLGLFAEQRADAFQELNGLKIVLLTKDHR